jgi:hypothetical protein
MVEDRRAIGLHEERLSPKDRVIDGVCSDLEVSDLDPVPGNKLPITILGQTWLPSKLQQFPGLLTLAQDFRFLQRIGRRVGQ